MKVEIIGAQIGTSVVAETATVTHHAAPNAPSARGSAAHPPLTILYLAADAQTSARLALDEELRHLTERLRRAGDETFRLVAGLAVRPDDLQLLLNEHRPQIVHFSGHANPAGELILLDEHRQERIVSAAAIVATLAGFPGVRLVFLNTCHTAGLARRIAAVVDFAVGVDDALEDDTAIVFAAAFYRALGFKTAIGAAVAQARAAALCEGIDAARLPTLFVKSGVSDREPL